MSKLEELLAPTPVSLREINSEHVNGHEIMVEGKAVAISDPEIIPTSIVYRCANCDRTYTKKVKQCEDGINCGSTAIEEEEGEFRDLQIIKIHEVKPKNNHTAKLVIVVRGKDGMWKVRAGQKIQATGILRVNPVRLTLEGKDKPIKRLEAEEVKVLDYKEAEYQVTPEDIERFKKDMDAPQFYEMLRASFAPFLVNMDEIKDACILTLASIRTTRPLNFLMVGDPSKAKSVIMEYVAQLAENGHFASASSTTWAGLSVTSEKDRDTETWILKYGAFPMGDEGLVNVDEIQNFGEEDLMKMNEVLESKRISYAKAGGNVGELPARCAVILACNPHHGKWMKGGNLQDNLRFMGRAREAFISRMALIFILQDEADEATDRAVAQSVIENSGEEVFRKYHEDTPDLYGSRTLKKFFSWIVTQPLPQVPNELYEELINFYVSARTKDTAGTKTPRFLKDAIRLAQMKARVLGKASIDKTDVDFAVQLLDKSLNEAAFDPKTQKIDANIVQGTIAASTQAERQGKEDQFYEAFDWACKDKDGNPRGYANESDITFRLVLQHKWADNRKTERYIENMLTRTGKFLEHIEAGKSLGWKKA